MKFQLDKIEQLLSQSALTKKIEEFVTHDKLDLTLQTVKRMN